MDETCSSSQCSDEYTSSVFVSAEKCQTYVSSRAPSSVSSASKAAKCSVSSASKAAKVVYDPSFVDDSMKHLPLLLSKVLPDVLDAVVLTILQFLGPIRCDVCAESWSFPARQRDGSWKGLCVLCFDTLRESEHSFGAPSHVDNCLIKMRSTSTRAPHLG